MIMPPFNKPIHEIIRERYSCREYYNTAIAAEQAEQLKLFLDTLTNGPLGTPFRFALVVANEQDRSALQGLGTYGLIKDPPGFIMGAVSPAKNNLEDFGYGLETAILYATSIGLETCWLGGNFTKHSFSRKIMTTKKEIVPAVAALGHSTEHARTRDKLRQKVKSDTRFLWDALFFEADFKTPLLQENIGVYSQPLEMLRLAPSAHNYQPWRVIREGACFHFYLQRTQGFGPGNLTFILLGVADLQKMEIGIAMCHFELTARELGLNGKWVVDEPELQRPDNSIEYVVTWIDGRSS